MAGTHSAKAYPDCISHNDVPEGGFCLRFALMISFEGRLVLMFKVLKVEASVMKIAGCHPQ